MTAQHHTDLLLERASSDAGISPDDFKAVFRHHPAGVAVVTMAGPFGFTATSVASVSADPAVLVFSVTAGSSARSVIEQVGSVAINFLAHDQREVAETFARRGIDRFAGVDWNPLPTGEPVLRGTAAWIRGEIDQRIPVGDSMLVTVRATLSERRDGAEPLVYVDRTYHRLSDDTAMR